MLKTVTFDDRPPLPSKWLIGGILPEGNCCIIGGEPKSYKTWLSLTCAVCLASGRDVLNKWSPRKFGTSLIYSPEGQGEGLRRRLYGLCVGMGLDYKEVLKRLHIIVEPVKLSLDNADNWMRLAETVMVIKPDMLIMDPLVHIHSVDENDNIAIQQILTQIRDLNKARPGLTIVLVHHTKKGGDSDGYGLRGASAIYGWLDTLITIRKNDEDPSRRIRIEHRDDIAPDPVDFFLQVTSDNGFYLEPRI